MRILPRLAVFIGTVGLIGVFGGVQSAHAITEANMEAKSEAMIALSAVPTPATEALEVTVGASLAFEALCDPEMCPLVSDFKSLYQPRVPAVPPVTVENLGAGFTGNITATTVQVFRAVAEAQMRVTAYEGAVRETVHRRYAATANKDEQSAAAQQKHLTELISGTAQRKQEASSAWQVLFRYPATAEIQEKPNSGPEGIDALIRKSGFPPSEMAMFSAFGLSPAEIDMAKRLVLKSADPKSAPHRLADVVPVMVNLNAQNADITSCQCTAPPK